MYIMDKASKKYSDREKRFIISKVKDILWANIPDVLKDFWQQELKKIDDGKRT